MSLGPRGAAMVAIVLLACASAQDVSLAVRLAVDDPLAVGEMGTLTVSVQNTGADDTEVRAVLSAPGLALVPPQDRATYALAPGTKGTTDWQVRSPAPGNHTVCVNVTGTVRPELDYPSWLVCVRTRSLARGEAGGRRAENVSALAGRGMPRRFGASTVPPPINVTLSLGAVLRENGTLRFSVVVENTGTAGDIVTVRVRGTGDIDVDPVSFNLPPRAMQVANVLVSGTDLLDVAVTVEDPRGRELGRARKLDRPAERLDWRMVVPFLLLLPIALAFVVKGRVLERLLPGMYVQRFERVADVREREAEVEGRRVTFEGKLILDEHFEYSHLVYLYDASGDCLAATAEPPVEEGIYTATGTLGRAEADSGYVKAGDLVLGIDSLRGEWQGGRSLYALRDHVRAVVLLAVLYLLASRRVRDLSVIEPWGNLQYLVLAPFSLPLVPILIAVVPLLAALVMGPVFCGWVCPAGFLHEVIGSRISRRVKALQRFNDRNLKYLALLVLVVVLLGFRSPALCQVCPFGDVLSRIQLKADPGLDELISADAYAGSPLGWRLGLLGALVVLAIAVQPIFWCRNLCPYGALLSVLGITKWNEVHVQRAACVECGLCERVCPYELGIVRGVHMNECTSCGRCVTSCFKNAISIRFGPELIRRNIVPAALGLLLVAILLMFPFAGAKVPVTIDYTTCIKCGACWEQYPQYFAQDNRTGFPAISEAAGVKVVGLTPEETERVVAVCPVGAIEARSGPGG